MLKRILTLVIAVMMIVGMLAGCGSKDSTSSADAKTEMAVASEVKAGDGNTEVKFAAKDQYGDVLADVNSDNKEEPKPSEEPAKANGSAIIRSGNETQTVANAILEQRKIIRNANISVEVEDFDKSYGQIKSMINAFGFIQESNVKKNKDSVGNPITTGIIVIRVDKDKFDEVLAGIKGLGDLIDESIKSDDVTDKFFDTESRLRLLRFEEGRLEEYLKKLNDPDTIFKTESRLTEIRHEIESLTGTLKKWNDLVALSTITINLYEKSAASSNIPVVKSYSNRLSETFFGSIDGVVKFFGELLIFIVGAFPIFIVLGILIWIGIAVYRKKLRKKTITSKSVDVENDNTQL